MSRLKILIFIFLGITLSVVVYSIYAYRGFLSTWKDTYREVKIYEKDTNIPETGEKIVSILLFVIDQEGLRVEGDMDKPGRSDVVLFCVLNMETGKITLLSIPRDLRVRIGPGKFEKLNHAYAYGPEYSINIIEDLLKFPVNYYIAFNYKAFDELIDLTGGIRIIPDKAIASRTNRIDEGFQRMDGEKAMFYVRFRSDHEGDMGRIRRQQQVAEAIMKQSINLHTFFNSGRLFDLAKNNLRHSIPWEFAGEHGREILSFKGADFEKITMEGYGVTIDSLWYFIPNRLQLLDIREKLRSELND